MKTKLLLAAALQMMTLSLFAQESTTRQLPPFTGIEIESIARIYLKQDSMQSVKASEGDFSHLETTVKNGTLHINGGPGTELYIALPKLEKINIEGKGEVIGQSAFSGDKLLLDIGGDGKMNMEAHYKEIKSRITGLGKITLNGTAERADFDISGSGKIDALELNVKNVDARISGLGKCLVDVTDTLNSDISGSGVVNYKNPPRVNNHNVSGVGKVGDFKSAGTKSDTTHLTFGRTDVFIVSPKDSVRIKQKSETKPIWGGLELGINSYMNANGNFNLPAGYADMDLKQEKSVSVGLNLIQKNYRLGKSNVWFFTGLGITWNNYRFANNVTLYPTTPVSTSVDTTSNVNHIKSKLVASYLTVPVMFEAFTSRDRKNAFHLGVGALLGLRIGSHTKQKYEIDGKTFKPKVYDDFNLNPFRYGVRVTAGYRKFNVFADYFFSPLFRDNKGPKMYPVNAGITLVGF